MGKLHPLGAFGLAATLAWSGPGFGETGGAPAKEDPPEEQLKKWVSELEKSPADRALREKIIKLALSLKPPPPIPEESRRHFVMAVALQKRTQEAKGLELALAEYRQALALAPWFPEAYYNLGVALDLAKKHDEAIENLKLYLLTGPKEAEAREAQDRIYAIEAAKKLAQVEDNAARKAEEARKNAEEARKREETWLKNLDGGRWDGSIGENPEYFCCRYFIEIHGDQLRFKWYVTNPELAGGKPLGTVLGDVYKATVARSEFPFLSTTDGKTAGRMLIGNDGRTIRVLGWSKEYVFRRTR